MLLNLFYKIIGLLALCCAWVMQYMVPLSLQWAGVMATTIGFFLLQELFPLSYWAGEYTFWIEQHTMLFLWLVGIGLAVLHELSTYILLHTPKHRKYILVGIIVYGMMCTPYVLSLPWSQPFHGIAWMIGMLIGVLFILLPSYRDIEHEESMKKVVPYLKGVFHDAWQK